MPVIHQLTTLNSMATLQNARPTCLHGKLSSSRAAPPSAGRIAVFPRRLGQRTEPLSLRRSIRNDSAGIRCQADGCGASALPGPDHVSWSATSSPNEAPLPLPDRLKQLAENVQRSFPSQILRVLPVAAAAVLVAATLRPKLAMAAVAAGTRIGGTAAGVHGHVTAANSGLLMSAWTGLAAGWLHTLSGPDHLAALAPLSIGRTRIESAAVGALWGCGHDVGQLLFGLLFVLLKDRLHLDVLKVWGARVVGLTLVTIGGMGIYEAQTAPIQCAPEDDECLSQPGAVVFAADKQAFNVATFATGIIHGLQPDALLVVLPALALPSKVAGASFLLMFLVGTILAMGTYTAFIGSCSGALHKRVPWLTHRLSLIASLIAIGCGGGIILGECFGLAIF